MAFELNYFEMSHTQQASVMIYKTAENIDRGQHQLLVTAFLPSC